jgi:DNA invertase Pin-like site-specific DNA recombinase
MNAIFAKDTHTETRRNTSTRVAIYCRLSKDDEGAIGESSSIQTQRDMLERYCAEQGWEVAAIFQDDGFTGLNMNRPDFQRMINAIERGEIDVVVTKDLSRLARNYIHTGHLLEEFFPKHGVRYLAIHDNVDTEAESAFDMTPFRAVMNQMYSADVSKKVHAAYLTKAQNGQFTGCLAPFGYRKSPDNHNRLIPDEDTAWIVKKIYEYAKDGRGANYIRRRLEEQEIPCPTWWNRQKGLRNATTKFERENPETGHFIWEFSTIKEILENPVYIGAIASQKQVYKFKAGKVKDKAPHEWLIVENMHTPLIPREDFDMVQAKIKSRKRPDAYGNYSLFAGIIRCGQCGATLTIRRTNAKSPEKIYTCSRYNKFGKNHCTQHRILYDTLYEIVLGEIRANAANVLIDEEAVIAELTRRTGQTDKSERHFIEKSISEDTARLASLEKLIAKLYEDLVAERISDDNFNAVLAKTQNEQFAIRTRLENNQQRLAAEQQEQADTARWAMLIKEHADIKELDTPTLQQLIQKIVIPEDCDGGIIRQTVAIHFNFIGQPNTLNLNKAKS